MHATPAPQAVTTLNASSALPQFLDRVRVGDRAAATELVAEFERFLRPWVRRHLLSGRDALRRRIDPDDILQAAWAGFAEVLAAGGTFRTPQCLTAFMLRLVRHRIADEARSVRGRSKRGPRKQHSDKALHELPSREADPATEAAASEQLAILLARLPAQHAEAVRAKLKGRSASAIAESMRISNRKMQMLLASAYMRWIRLFGDRGAKNRV